MDVSMKKGKGGPPTVAAPLPAGVHSRLAAAELSRRRRATAAHRMPPAARLLPLSPRELRSLLAVGVQALVATPVLMPPPACLPHEDAPHGGNSAGHNS